LAASSAVSCSVSDSPKASKYSSTVIPFGMYLAISSLSLFSSAILKSVADVFPIPAFSKLSTVTLGSLSSMFLNRALSSFPNTAI
jgi:hypothetical protein